MALPVSPAAFNAVRWTRIRKTLAQLTICIVAVTAVTAILYALPLHNRPLFPALVFLFVVLIVSAVLGFRYAVFVSFLTALGFLWLLPPVGQFWLDDARDVFTLVAFLLIAIVAGYLSERARRETLARRSEKELRDVIETMPAMAWTALPDGSNIFASKGWTEYTGLSVEDSEGPGWQAAVHPEDLDRYVEKWRASLGSGQPFESEVRFRRAADGEYRWFLARAVPLRDERGNILKWYGILADIEDRKRAEQERDRLRRLEADLAYMSRVITIGELAASLAHEIKQPLAAAVMNANACERWLRRDAPDVTKACDSAALMVNDVTRAADIIDRVRSLYRRDAPELKRVDLNEIIREMVGLLHDTANRNSISIRTELDLGLPTATADRVQLQQVVMNLMFNGIEAMKDMGGDLTVTSNRTEDGQLLISVSDLGIGLPADQTERIFDSFFTTKPQGTGMGLSISRRIIESHGGRLWASADTARGATFQFRLPSEVTASCPSAS
ncbi:MAG TPA: ATP-binding protein [Steroidobacteraceae bacterium]